MLERGDELVTSFMTVGEIQVKGLKEGRLDMAADLKQRVLLTSTVLHFDSQCRRCLRVHSRHDQCKRS